MRPLLVWLSKRRLRLLHAAGAALGWAAYLLSPTYRSRLKANAALAGVGRAQRRASVAEAGKLVMELPRLWLRPRDQAINDPVEWERPELVDQALDQGRGLVLLTPHMGSFEVAAQAYAERFGARQPITVLYRPAKQAWLLELEETARARPALATAPATLAGVRQLMRALRQGQTLGMLPDQVPPEGMGVWAPFFGQPAYTMTLAARLAQQAGAAVLLIWAERLPQGGGYRVCLRPLAEPLPDKAGLGEEAWTAAAAASINRSMEAVIAHKPDQYLWGYHRYKQPRPMEPAA
ncbi:MAG: lysophospholipid acyltransferase family protein [Rubrivivax sp.]|nr:lysophospholipid acyltransferase family protein [Rubrivivax sp.]MDP3224686.1 lysophospholipid acyltransferase family protein [Rubrivivax sp.]